MNNLSYSWYKVAKTLKFMFFMWFLPYFYVVYKVWKVFHKGNSAYRFSGEVTFVWIFSYFQQIFIDKILITKDFVSFFIGKLSINIVFAVFIYGIIKIKSVYNLFNKMDFFENFDALMLTDMTNLNKSKRNEILKDGFMIELYCPDFAQFKKLKTHFIGRYGDLFFIKYNEEICDYLLENPNGKSFWNVRDKEKVKIISVLPSGKVFTTYLEFNQTLSYSDYLNMIYKEINYFNRIFNWDFYRESIFKRKLNGKIY